LEEKLTPSINIALLFVADEETGSTYGLDYLIENHRELFNDDDLFIVPDAGEADGAMIEVAEKSILWLKFKTTGTQVHASLPGRGNNAFKAGANLVVELDQLHTVFNGKNDVFDPPISTFEPTRKESNVLNINTIPGEDIFFMDCRILPRYALQDVLREVKRITKEIEKKFNVSIEISIEQEEQAASATSADAPVVNLLKNAIKKVYKLEPRAKGIGGGTVAAIFRRAGLDVAVWSKIDDMAHQPNEYCVIDNIINDAKVLGHVCLQ
jgi:succinyl-diaminopimelate desuccinylase